MWEFHFNNAVLSLFPFRSEEFPLVLYSESWRTHLLLCYLWIRGGACLSNVWSAGLSTPCTRITIHTVRMYSVKLTELCSIIPLVFPHLSGFSSLGRFFNSAPYDNIIQWLKDGCITVCGYLDNNKKRLILFFPMKYVVPHQDLTNCERQLYPQYLLMLNIQLTP